MANQVPEKMRAKDKYRIQIYEYLSDPENEPLPRTRLAEEVLDISRKTLYTHFRPEELDQIEAQALTIRRGRLSTHSAAVDAALFKRAVAGDVQAIKLWYQRMEGWSEKSVVTFGEPTDDEIRQLAMAKGYDPDEYLRVFKEASEKNGDRVH